MTMQIKLTKAQIKSLAVYAGFNVQDCTESLPEYNTNYNVSVGLVQHNNTVRNNTSPVNSELQSSVCNLQCSTGLVVFRDGETKVQVL